MSKVMTENKVQVRYTFSREFIGQCWVKTGQFVGYGRDLAIECDTPERRALIVALDWHDELQYGFNYHDLHIIGKYHPKGWEMKHYRNTDDYQEYDHELTVDEIWAEIKRMVAEKESSEQTEKASA